MSFLGIDITTGPKGLITKPEWSWSLDTAAVLAEVHRERGIIPVSRELESRLSCAIQCLKIGKYRQNYKLRVLLVLYSRESDSLAVGIGSIIRYLRRYKKLDLISAFIIIPKNS